MSSTLFLLGVIAKKAQTILFIRVQGPQDKQTIDARSFQSFVGQTVLYSLENPLYKAYDLKWVYVCSKMMCDKSAKIYINAHQESLAFEQIDIKKEDEKTA
jgi:hypothetical protein